MNNLDRRIQIYKMRISTLIDEHADALAQAQELHSELKEAKIQISDLEQKLRNNNVQEKDTESIIISQSVGATEHQGKIS